MEAVPGYLSLHQSAESLTLKWTPNQLMNGTLGDSELEKRWGLWDLLPGAREGSGGLPCRQGDGKTQSAPGDSLTPYPDAKNYKERLPGKSPKLSKIKPGLGMKKFDRAKL